MNVDFENQDDPASIVEKILIRYAKQKKTITYSRLSVVTGGLRPHRFWHKVLMDVSALSKEKFNGLDISILVVSKTTGIPGKGFGQALSQADYLKWNMNAEEFFQEKSQEIFTFFENYKTKEEKEAEQPTEVIPGHKEIDFLF